MPRARKLRVSARKTARAEATLRPAAIDKARSDAMARIAQLRDRRGEAGPFLDKAQRLLTRHWARSGWAARATLVKTAGWLIRLAAAGARARPKASAR